ncbi:MAG: YggS family pyridoxal phosphate-dependent enzyme [Lachnospiraceae bacterium]|nr:YggS family pyridoxal phosphate-dependent enzyme [Lachnospiraceae bacterium]MEE1341728.1 YggS family pyridoxal phosphate-dependent enzyme [Lachnospiraceae bacterium]
MLKENLEAVQKNIIEACKKVGRDSNEVTLIAVSKTKPLSDIEEIMDLGVIEFGENKVQELVDKYENIKAPVHWHLIGHLQTNKVKYIVDKVALIHSVDSLKLAEQISKEAVKKNVISNILVQVNVAKEETKFGIETEEVYDLVEKISKLPNISIQGLMTIAPFVENPEENRLIFRKLHQLYVDIKQKNIDNVNMNVLSMGMTNDYQVAIEEGATMVRVGTGIFGARNYNI